MIGVDEHVWRHGWRGFTGFKTAAAEELLGAFQVMDPFHVVGHDLLTDKQKDRLEALFAPDNHAEVEATWGIHRRIIAA